MAKPSLSSQQVRKIEGLIKGWGTKLTMKLLLQRIETDLGIITTHTTLYSYAGIAATYKAKKKELRGAPPESLIQFSQQDVDMSNQIKRLKAENAILTARVERQMAFINEIAEAAKNNPSVMNLMENVKLKVSKNG